MGKMFTTAIICRRTTSQLWSGGRKQRRRAITRLRSVL
jgi:hypothetical protein